ncbi:hypothetical protein [Nocardia sp. CS682]|uniref:hypothetical protein n=1 Tax=Nocardia sp. CS682 TaxID=1047172 RepID=UPI001074ED5A|nr:hypothetical protein [Nocardia sp. CS682]
MVSDPVVETIDAEAVAIDPVALVRETRKLAEQNPDFVYTKIFDDEWDGYKCRYVEAGCGSCLVGQAAINAGVPLRVVASWDLLGDTGIEHVMSRYGFADHPATAWLIGVQVDQDGGATWAGAVHDADRNVGEVGA